jgi:hypothetical protein
VALENMFKRSEEPSQANLISPSAFEDPALAQVLAHQTRAVVVGRIVGDALSFEECLKLGLAVKQCLALAKKFDDAGVDERVCKFQLRHYPRVTSAQMHELLKPIKAELSAELQVTLRDKEEQRARATWVKRIVGDTLTFEECAKLGMAVKLQVITPPSSSLKSADRWIVEMALKSHPSLHPFQVEEIARVARHEHQPDLQELRRRLKSLPVAAPTGQS